MIVGTTALTLTFPTIATSLMPLTTVYAAATSGTNYSEMDLAEKDTQLMTDMGSVKVASMSVLQKAIDDFKTDDTLVSGKFYRYAPIYDGEARATLWGKGDCMHPVHAPNDFIYNGETSHKQYGDFYATMSIRYPHNYDTLFMATDIYRVDGQACESIRYEAKCFENETIFGLNAKKTSDIKAKIQELKTTGASFTGTSYEKAKAAYNWTINNTTFNPLGDSKTFASTFYWLCEGANVDSMMYISDDESRVFNVVSLDSKNYLVDTYAAADESDTTNKYLCFAPASTDTLHAVKVSVASENYDPNAKNDNTATNPGTPSDDNNDNNGGSSDDSDNSGDNGGSGDSGSGDSDGGSSSDSSTSASTPTSNYEGRMQTAVSDSYVATTSAPSVVSNADTGIYAYDNNVKAAIQSVLPEYNVQSYINIATSAATGTFRMLTPVECLLKNPGLISGDITAVKKYYLVYCNNGIVQVLPNTSDSPYLITAPIYGSGNYAIVMAQ